MCCGACTEFEPALPLIVHSYWVVCLAWWPLEVAHTHTMSGWALSKCLCTLPLTCILPKDFFPPKWFSLTWRDSRVASAPWGFPPKLGINQWHYWLVVRMCSFVAVYGGLNGPSFEWFNVKNLGFLKCLVFLALGTLTHSNDSLHRIDASGRYFYSQAQCSIIEIVHYLGCIHSADTFVQRQNVVKV